jgi:diguanylate cyclase (GGDEF)-like protein
MADVDHLTTINDSFGRAAGEQALKAVADALTAAVRLTDVVGRYGDDEFLTMLPSCALGQARVVAERMRAGVSGTTLTFRPDPLTTSFGIAQWLPGDTVASLVGRAAQSLRAAKQAGRDQVAG